jgi:hypothetical protein
MKCVLAKADDLNLIADLDSPSGTGETYGHRQRAVYRWTAYGASGLQSGRGASAAANCRADRPSYQEEVQAEDEVVRR